MPFYHESFDSDIEFTCFVHFRCIHAHKPSWPDIDIILFASFRCVFPMKLLIMTSNLPVSLISDAFMLTCRPGRHRFQAFLFFPMPFLINSTIMTSNFSVPLQPQWRQHPSTNIRHSSLPVTVLRKHKARAAGSWCADFQRNGASYAWQRRMMRAPETSLHQANSLNATGTHSGGRLHI